MYPTYAFTNSEYAPAVVSLNGNSSPVWIQDKWEDGEYAQYIRKNGCGHCCTAMALNLNGVTITPHEEFVLCRKMWGEPRMGMPLEEDNFLSAAGIVKVLNSFDIKAKCFGVQTGQSQNAAKHIENSLSDGKLVILWSHPSEKLDPNPFSSGEHYILLTGIDAESKILVANSSSKADTDCGIQHTDVETIAKVFWDGCDPDQSFTWGRYDLAHSGGYVVVG